MADPVLGFTPQGQQDTGSARRARLRSRASAAGFGLICAAVPVFLGGAVFRFSRDDSRAGIAALTMAAILTVVAVLGRRLLARERILTRERGFLDLVLNNAGEAVLVSEASGRRLRANPAFLAMLGESPNDLDAAGGLVLVPLEDHARIAALFAATDPKAYPRRQELALVNKHGEQRLIHWSTSVLEVEAGKVTSTVSIGTDVTSDRRYANMLRQANRIAKIAYWHWRPRHGRSQDERDGDYTYTDETEDLFGYTPQALADASNGYWSLVVHPDDRALGEGRFVAFLRGSETVHVQEYRIQHAKLGERVIRETAEKTFDSAGNVIEMAGTLQDVTDARQAQQALRESEIKLRRGFRMAKLGHWVYEPGRQRADGTFGVHTYSENVAEIYGVSGETLDASGDTFYDIYIHPDDRDELFRVNKAFLVDDRKGYTHEYRFIKPNGSIAYIRESAEKVLDETGRLVQVLGTIQDVTDQRLADIALRENESKLKQGFRISKMGHWTVDCRRLEGKLATTLNYSWSAEAAEIFGVPVAELDTVGRNFYERYVHPGDREKLRRNDDDFLSSDTPSYTHEFRILLPDGSIRHLLESAEKLYDGGGRLVQIIGIVQDITGHKRSALSMRRVERQMRRAYRLAKLGYWFWEVDELGSDIKSVSNVSDEVYEILGVTRDQVSWDDNAAFCKRYVHPEDREMLLRVFEEFEIGRIDNYTVSYRFCSPNGEIRQVRSVAERVRDDKGNALYGIGIIQDLTDVKTAEAALRRSEHQLRRAQRVAKLYCWHTELGPDGVERMVFDSDFYADALQLGPETIIENPTDYVHRFVHPEDRPRLLPIINAFDRGDIDAYSAEYRLQRLDGSLIYIRSAAERMRDAEGHVLQTFGAIQDVTDLKQHERELIEAKNDAELANRSKSEFLANMSHELRTPLNAIIGFSEVIRDQLFGPDPARYIDYAIDIHESGRHLHELINDILDVSKLEAGKRDLYEEELSLDEAIKASLNMVTSRASEKAVKLSTTGVDRLPPIWAEGRAMIQILVNLLSNAVKFTPRNGQVRVEGWRTSDGAIAVSVADTGIGIAPEALPHIFEPFRQGDNSISRKFGGTGLGLAITRRLVDLHGGRIDVVSKPDEGTTITVFLPAERVVAEDEPAPAATDRPHASGADVRDRSAGPGAQRNGVNHTAAIN
jgi:PAS domain S-box-containing protein